MNLLESFMLQHVQVSLLHGELLRVSRDGGAQEARVEMNLTPRLVETGPDDALPSYQVSARLVCEGAAEGDLPSFKAQVGFETLYQQVSGAPVDIAEFTSHHASLARQVYPLLAQELRGLLTRLGISSLQLPFDLNPTSRSISVSGGQAPNLVH